MATIRKSNLRGRKRWLRQDSAHKETNIRGSRVNEYTSLPPLPKSTPEFLSRQRHSKPSFFSKNSSSINSKTSPSPRVKPQRINSNSVNNKNREHKNQNAIPVMPDGSKVPMWLMRWNSFHRKTSVITFLLVGATLIVYGWTVYSQSFHKYQNCSKQRGVENSNWEKGIVRSIKSLSLIYPSCKIALLYLCRLTLYHQIYLELQDFNKLSSVGSDNCQLICCNTNAVK